MNFFVARCKKCHKVVAAAVANTIEDQEIAMPEVKKWKRRGDDCELVKNIDRIELEDCACD